MNSQKKKRYSFATRVAGWTTAQALVGFTAIAGRWPDRFLPLLSRVLGSLSYYLLRERRTIGLKNIAIAWGDSIPAGQRQAIIKRVFKNIALDLLEGVRTCVSPVRIATMDVSIEGKERLDNALKKGNGVIALSAHVGNFPLITVKLASLGYPFWLIFKHPKNPRVTEIYYQWADQVSVKVIPYKPRRVCARESLRVLNDNGIVMLLIDQNPRKRYGAYVEFFGHEVPTYTGPVVMAQRSGAALLPMFMHRGDDGSQVLTILPELSLAQSGDRKTSITDSLRMINRLYEEWITAYPDQWWWIHRRFRRARAIPQPRGNSPS